jgi:hypothetical protein
MALHKNVGPQDVHIIYAFTFTNAVARLAYTAVAGDLGKAAYQQSDGTFWLIVAESPTVWAKMVPPPHTITAGAGLAGGGPSDADVTLYIEPSADGSIVVNADGVAVGVLATDVQHGLRDGGDLHSAATQTTHGFLSANDKIKLDTLLPSLEEKGALAGSFGTPDGSNRYVTATDPRFLGDVKELHVGANQAFTSIKTAVESIVGASSTAPYIVRVAAGTYVESPFTIPSYVLVTGAGLWDETIIQTNDQGAHFINLAAAGQLAHCGVVGPTGAGFAAVNYTGTGYRPAFLYHVVIKQGYYGVWAHPASYGTIHCHEVVNAYAGSRIENFIRTTDYGVSILLNCSYMSGPPASVGTSFYASGPHAQVTMDVCAHSNSGSSDALFADDGAKVRANSCSFTSGTNAIHVGANGTGTEIHAAGCVIGDGFTTDFFIETANCEVEYSGTGHRAKCSIAAGAAFSAFFANDVADGGGAVVWGELWLGQSGQDFPLRSFATAYRTTGSYEGGAVERATGLQVQVRAGKGFIGVGTGMKIIEWPDTLVTLSANKTETWVVVDVTGVPQELITAPDVTQVIELGDAATSASAVAFLTSLKGWIPDPVAARFLYARDVVGPINVSGGAFTKHAATSLQVDVDASTFYILDNRKQSAAASPATFTVWYRNGSGGWNTIPGQNTLDTLHYDNGSGTLALIPAGKFVRVTGFVSVNDSGTEFHAVVGQEYFDTLELAIRNPVIPPILQQKACLLGAAVVQQAGTDILAVYDQRPKLGQLAAAGTAVTSHGQLAGLSADDHTQYQLRSQRNAANGYAGLDATSKLPLAALTLSSSAPPQISKGAAAVGASTSLAREDHGHDVATAAPVTVGTANAQGTSTSLARADHVHDHGAQTGTSLHALATTGAHGFLSSTDKAKLDGLPASAVPTTRLVGTGNGLTGGGALSADRTLSVAPDADGSIAVAAGGVKVGVLATDAQHGVRGGGTQHAAATQSVNGFLSAADKTKLDGVQAGADLTPISNATPVVSAVDLGSAGVSTAVSRADHDHGVAAGSPVAIGTANADGVSTSLSRADHVHAHGNQAGGALHAVASGAADGFMAAADKTKLDAIPVGGGSSVLKSTTMAEVSTDTTTTSTSWVDLLTITLTMASAGKLLAQFSAGFTMSGANNGAYFRIMVDGTAKRGVASRYINTPGHSVAISYLASGLAAGSHTVKVQWRASASTLQIRPAGQPDSEHAVLIVQEVTN